MTTSVVTGVLFTQPRKRLINAVIAGLPRTRSEAESSGANLQNEQNIKNLISSFGRGSTSFALSEQAMPAFISVAFKKSRRDDMSVEKMVAVNKIP
jgi:hypothetical protein